MDTISTITTVATVPAIIALVTIAKDLGLRSKLSPVLAIVLGIALSIFESLAVSNGAVNWYEAVGLGLILGLSASGLYDGARAIGGKGAEYEIEIDGDVEYGGYAEEVGDVEDSSIAEPHDGQEVQS